MPVLNAASFEQQVAAIIRAAAEEAILPRFRQLLATEVEEKSPGELVTIADRDAEVLISRQLLDLLPGSRVVGEEAASADPSLLDEVGTGAVWLVDPLDGTSNFVNGFPLFSASIGVLYRGEPMVGALWCSTSHTLRSGVYHARAGSALRFDSQPVIRVPNPMVHRRLGGDPSASTRGLPWDIRKTGSAAIECAFVAAGLLQVTRFDQPNIWDVAGGIALVQAAGRRVVVREGKKWQPFTGFGQQEAAGTGPAGEPKAHKVLRDWRRSLVLGEEDAIARATQIFA